MYRLEKRAWSTVCDFYSFDLTEETVEEILSKANDNLVEGEKPITYTDSELARIWEGSLEGIDDERRVYKVRWLDPEQNTYNAFPIDVVRDIMSEIMWDSFVDNMYSDIDEEEDSAYEIQNL